MHLVAVSKAYQSGSNAVQGVDLKLRGGEVLGLVGPNGSGKSTLLGIMGGMIEPTSGTVSYDEHTSDSVQFRRSVGLATQDQALDPELSPNELLNLFASLFGLNAKTRAERISAIIEDFDLAEFSGQRIAELSGGQRQRVHLGLLFLQRPDVLLLDEPTQALDQPMREKLKLRLAKHRDEGRTLVIATHELDSWASLFTNIAFVAGGQLVAMNNQTELIDQYGSLATAYTQLCGKSPPPGPQSRHQGRRGKSHG